MVKELFFFSYIIHIVGLPSNFNPLVFNIYPFVNRLLNHLILDEQFAVLCGAGSLKRITQSDGKIKVFITPYSISIT